jgi:hypothetical protein
LGKLNFGLIDKDHSSAKVVGAIGAVEGVLFESLAEVGGELIE